MVESWVWLMEAREVSQYINQAYLINDTPYYYVYALWLTH